MIKFTKNSGFTLVETLVALSLFSVALLGVIVSLGQGISDTGYVKRKMTAEYLAAEGIEYIRNFRDTYTLYSATGQAGWTSFNSRLTGANCNTTGCYFNSSGVSYTDNTTPIYDLTLTSCASCPTLYYHSTTGKYDYDPVGGVNSGFSRKINTSAVNVNETRISSTVTWTEKSRTYSITFSENLYNWVE
ncbi:MAG: prepilin-type N-terminal cleavage/methylation domain-containing protein [Patescibacteria group bacterium]